MVPQNDAPTASGSKAHPEDEAYLALHAEREAIERALSLAQARQRFGTDDVTVAAARGDEADLLGRLDRVMTMIRAAEYRRRPGARRW